MATFLLVVSDLQLTNAQPGLIFLDETFRLEFKVGASTPTHAVEVTQWLGAGNLPWNLAYYGAPYAILQNFNVKAQENTLTTKFIGTATYIQKSDNDSYEAAKITFRENSYEKILIRARDENGVEVGVLNSAGDNFAEGLVETEKRLVIVIEKSYDPVQSSPGGFRSYFNSVNQNAITIADTPIAPRAGKMMSITPQIRIVSGTSYYWRVVAEIEVRTNGENYDREVLDQGLSYLELISDPASDSAGVVTRDGLTYRRVRAQTLNPETGEYEPSDDPILLNGAGGKLGDVSPGGEVYLRFRSKPEKNWHALDLPRTIWETV